MNRQNVRLKDWLPLYLVLCFVVVSAGLLSGCTRANRELADSSSTATSQATEFTTTSTPYSLGTSTPDDKQDFNTRVAQFDATIVAQVTLSPRPTVPEGPIYLESPIPTPTWQVGYAGGPLRENTFNPQYISCWYGTLNDKLLQICAGHEQLGGDPQQGVVRIKLIEQDQVTTLSQNVYETPEKVGVMHIVIADSNSVTIASEDGQAVFTFDIATRQWIRNPPLPTPSVSPLPLPSASP